MPIASEATIRALALRIDDFQAKITAARHEINWALNKANAPLDPDDLEHLEIYIAALTEVIEETTQRLQRAQVTLHKARESRVTGRLQ